MNLILCLFIVVICALIGRICANRMTERLDIFREYQLAFTHLSDNVVGLNLELYKALVSCGNGRISPAFDCCADVLRTTPQVAFGNVWTRGFRNINADCSSLTKDDLQIIFEGGNAIEALCRNPSEKQAGIYLKRLSAYTETLEKEKNKKCKLYNSAGVLAGLMIALLVI